MAIVKQYKVTISKDAQATTDYIYVYQHDRGVDLQFSIIDMRELGNGFRGDILKGLSDMYSTITIVKPDSSSFKSEKLPIVSGKVLFTITEELTDELTEIGMYTLQIHLHDIQDNRITIPEVQFEVKELISDLDCENTGAVAGYSRVGMTEVASEQVLFTFTRGYSKTTWATGDKITAVKLNNLEAGLETVTAEVEQLKASGGGTGTQGPKGDKGDTGATPNISIGSVVTLAPGQNATVTKTGTAEAPVLNFAIPKGDKGDTGTGGSGGTDPNSHTHANKTVLDGITEQKVAEWDAINIGILASNDGTQFILRVNNDGTLYTERTYIPEVALPSDFPKYVFTGGSTHEDDFLITPHTDNQNLGYIFIMNKKGQVKWYKKLTSFAYSFKKCKNKAGKIRYCYHQTINKEYPKFSMNGGYDNNKLVVMDENYNIIDEAKLQPYGSLQSVTPCENHDYLFIDDEHYILTAYTANVVNNIPGVTGDIRVVNVVIQELKNNEVVWQFESKDDTELYTASHTNNNYAKFSTTQNINTDYAHLNSVVLDKRDGNLLTSWRHIGLIKIERFTGKILWVMGRNRNDITGSTTAQCGYLQHDARYNNDYSITIFDNSGCATNNTRFCRYWIDEANKAITKFEGVTSTRARSPFMGSAKIINEPNNVYEVAYGGAWKDIAFEQYDFKNNKQLMKLVFNEGHDLYRVFSGIEDYSWDNAEKPTVPLNSISIPTALKLNVNEEQTLAVTYNPPDARNKQVTFKSDQPLIAKVDTTGKVTGLSDGLAVIICTSDEGSYTSQCVVTVEAQTISVTGVALSQLSASINVDATLDLTATIQPNGANNKNVSWSCNNSNVNIIPNGLKCTVTGARTGESIVTVTTEEHSYTDSCSINISENTLENYAAYLIQGKSSVGCAFTNHVAATSIDCQGFECSPKFLGFDFPTNTLGTDTTYMFCESLLTVTDTEKKNNNIECIAGAREGVKNFLTVKILKTKATTPDNFKTYFNDNPTHINIRLKENVKKYMIDINNIELVNTTHSAPGYTCGEFIASDLPFATCTEDKVYIPNLGYSNDWGGSANWSYFKISEWQGSVYVGFQIRNELLETQDLEGIRKYISKSPYIYYIN